MLATVHVLSASSDAETKNDGGDELAAIVEQLTAQAEDTEVIDDEAAVVEVSSSRQAQLLDKVAKGQLLTPDERKELEHAHLVAPLQVACPALARPLDKAHGHVASSRSLHVT